MHTELFLLLRIRSIDAHLLKSVHEALVRCVDGGHKFSTVTVFAFDGNT